MTEPALALDNIRFAWPGKSGFSLTCSAFAVAPHETVLLIGESGSGKSTLLSLLCGTIFTERGAVHVNGTDLKSLSKAARDRFRAENIGVIFQQFNLLPFGSVMDNILLPLRFAPERRKRCPDPNRQIMDLCHALGLPIGVEKSKASRLSVGQQQRVAVARALIGNPPILIADEPTSALDETARAHFLDLMFDQVRAQNTTLLMVSHDPRLASQFDRVVHMRDTVSLERKRA